MPLKKLQTSDFRLQLSHPFARRADDRLDELMVRVFVPEAHQLAQALTPVRAIVVATAKIKRPDRIVRRPDGENADAAGRRQAQNRFQAVRG